jgi:hypothetical protein
MTLSHCYLGGAGVFAEFNDGQFRTLVGLLLMWRTFRSRVAPTEGLIPVGRVIRVVALACARGERPATEVTVAFST